MAKVTKQIETGERSLKGGNEADGELIIVRASKLAEEGRVGTVASGTFEAAKPNKFNATKNDYFIRGSNNELYIVNGTSGLQEQMDQLKGMEGSATVRIAYNGKIPTKSGRGYHDFEVFVTNSQAV